MLLGGPGVAVEDGERHEHAAGMVDAGKAGVGEKIDDLRPFDAADMAKAIAGSAYA